MARNCGNCDYCAENGEDLVCVNQDSEYCGCFIDDNHCCCDYEGGNGND